MDRQRRTKEVKTFGHGKSHSPILTSHVTQIMDLEKKAKRFLVYILTMAQMSGAIMNQAKMLAKGP